MAENRTAYEISFTWNNGRKDSMIIYGLKKKNACIKDMLFFEVYSNIEYQAIYKSGKRGNTVKIL